MVLRTYTRLCIHPSCNNIAPFICFFFSLQSLLERHLPKVSGAAAAGIGHGVGQILRSSQQEADALANIFLNTYFQLARAQIEQMLPATYGDLYKHTCHPHHSNPRLHEQNALVILLEPLVTSPSCPQTLSASTTSIPGQNHGYLYSSTHACVLASQTQHEKGQRIAIRIPQQKQRKRFEQSIHQQK